MFILTTKYMLELTVAQVFFLLMRGLVFDSSFKWYLIACSSSRQGQHVKNRNWQEATGLLSQSNWRAADSQSGIWTRTFAHKSSFPEVHSGIIRKAMCHKGLISLEEHSCLSRTLRSNLRQPWQSISSSEFSIVELLKNVHPLSAVSMVWGCGAWEL